MAIMIILVKFEINSKMYKTINEKLAYIMNDNAKDSLITYSGLLNIQLIIDCSLWLYFGDFCKIMLPINIL